MSFDTTRLIAQVNLKGSLPEGRFTDQEILDIAYDCLLSEIVPAVLMCREEFYVTHQDVTIVANQDAYPVPARALNGVLREIKLVDGTNIKNLTRKSIEDISSVTSGTPESFYLQNNSIYLHPTPTEAKTLRVYCFIRPSKLVPVSECAAITNINSKSVSVTIPSTWTASNTFDLVKSKGGNEILAMDQTVTVCSGSVITFNDDLPSNLAVGDYVCLSEESCFPFMPTEGQIALIQQVVATCLESIGDPAAAAAAQKAQFLLEKFQSVLKLRVQGECNLGIRLL